MSVANHPQVSFQNKNLTNCDARIDWSKTVYPLTDIVVTIDRNVNDDLGCVVHELLHLHFFDFMYRHLDHDLEELMVESFERHLSAYIKKRPSRLRLWQEMLDRKLSARDQEGGE